MPTGTMLMMFGTAREADTQHYTPLPKRAGKKNGAHQDTVDTLSLKVFLYLLKRFWRFPFEFKELIGK